MRSDNRYCGIYSISFSAMCLLICLNTAQRSIINELPVEDVDVGLAVVHLNVNVPEVIS